MENRNSSLPERQALETVPKNKEKIFYERKYKREAVPGQENLEASAKWFKGLSIGSSIYAVFYAFCMYQNTEGITFPFCVGATLFFFLYYAKKFCGTVQKCDLFLMITAVLLGIITCTTDSGVLIYFNKLGIFLLLCVFLLELFHDVTGWGIGSFAKAGFYTVFGSIGQMVAPFTDGTAFWKVRKQQKEKGSMDETKKQKYTAILLGVVISIPMLFIIILLLSSADVYFRELFTTIFSWEIPELYTRKLSGFVGTILVMFLFSYGSITYTAQKKLNEKAVTEKAEQWNAYTAITFSSIIGVVYVIFAGIQILGLFMGALTLPEGYTYAGYARQGFFQLAFVCFFNICLVMICAACFKEHRVIKFIMTVISICTYVMLVSSAYRMLLYISVYQLTFLRVFVLWAIVLMAIIMAGVMVYVYRKQFPIFRYLLVSVTVLYIGFAAAHPDYWIARYNTAQAKAGQEIDEYYLLFNLSLDAAVPILDYYENNLRQEMYYDEHFKEWKKTEESNLLSEYCRRIERETEDMNRRSFNFSRAAAGYKNREYQKLSMEYIKAVKNPSP